MMVKQFLSCDWGTSSFRLRLLDAVSKSVTATVTDRKGIADVYSKWQQAGLTEVERVPFCTNILQQYITKLDIPVAGVPILISGMASSSIGIKDVPYGSMPFDLDEGTFSTAHIPASDQFDHAIFIISGLRTNNDAMRGEETILFGCDTKSNDGIYVFPGTHSKHVLVSNNAATDVKTYMTGEIFDLLSNKSILSASVEKKDDDSMEACFNLGVEAAREGSFLNTIFHVRTNMLFNKLSPAENYNYLSGLVIGTELKEIQSHLDVCIVSENLLMKTYLKAAEILQLKNVRSVNADAAMINAHLKIASSLFK